MPSPFLFIAHRGSPLRTPENTLPSFLQAEKDGASDIETDIQLTADGVPVLCHDNTLRRYGHGEHSVGSLSLSQIQQLDFGAWFHSDFRGVPILLLEDMLRRFGKRFRYHLELKDDHPDTAATTLHLLGSLGIEATITSFHRSQLERLRGTHTRQNAGWLVKQITPEVVAVARDLQLQQICPKAENITEETLDLAGEFEIRAWGCPRQEGPARELVDRVRQTSCTGITVDEVRWFLPSSA